MTLVIVSGYFDPIHAGHIEYLERARALGSKLIVILNSDDSAIKKKGYIFMPMKERAIILSSIRWVDKVISSVDTDATVCKTIEMIYNNFQKFDKKIIFAKGGDRTKNEIPEREICDKLGIEIIDGLGFKIQSSSELVKNSYNKRIMNL